MRPGEFLSDRLGHLVLWGGALGFSALFLLATGTQPDVVWLLLAVLLPVLAAEEAAAFFRLRARLRELETVMEGLDRKYLFAACAPPPQNAYERCLFSLVCRAGQSMTGEVSQAQAAQRAYREYVESWVHEVKTPITAARLLSRRLDGETRRKLDQELSQIEAHVERALFYARAESPERDCAIRRLSLDALVSQALQAHRTLLIQSGVRVETASLDQTVYTDEKWAVFLLGQLLQNAARYRRDAPVIHITARPLGRQVQLTVEDNGIGIPAHELPRIFDRGFTGSNGRLAIGNSTGMGLYLCRRLAEFLEIGLRAESKEGRGTTIFLAFPANLSKL